MPRKFRAETNTQLNEWNKNTINVDATGIRIVNLRHQLQQGALAATVSTDNTYKVTFIDFEGDIPQNLMFFIPLLSANRIKDSLLQAGCFLQREFEALGNTFYFNCNIIL